MELGAFSLSLNVKDIQASKAFYQKIGFEIIGGNEIEKWLILKNEDKIIGLFEGMLEKNMLTFNPKWNAKCETIESAPDVRELQKKFQESGINIIDGADPNSTGPASFMIEDPDGNPILFDQHAE